MKFSKKLYYILSWTWGIIMSLIGAIGALYHVCRGRKIQRHGGCFWIETGKNWGGVNLGMFFFYQEGADESGKNHEYGHSLQNCIWGPLFPFVIAIPSAIRYHYRRQLIKKGEKPTTDYDDVWFEGQATDWGTKTVGFWK